MHRAGGDLEDVVASQRELTKESEEVLAPCTTKLQQPTCLTLEDLVLLRAVMVNSAEDELTRMP